MSNIIKSILRSKLCAGCGLCHSIDSKGRIKFGMDSTGYLRPRCDDPLDEETIRKIETSCPGLTVGHEIKCSAEYDFLWGPVVRTRTAFSVDREIRNKASSGGVITSLLSYLLDNNLVDYVLHIGASSSDPLLNDLKESRTRADIVRNSGSRYLPSAPLATIQNNLGKKGTFALVGKPCDISALRRYSKIDRRVNEKCKLMISFFCAGIPSIDATLKLLEKLDVRKENVADLRYRGNGWPGNFTVKENDGATKTMTYVESWGGVLSKYLQFRCKICPDGTGEFADIVCGDGWETPDGYPDFEEKEGLSLVISRSSLGEHVLSESVEKNYINGRRLNLCRLSKMQPFQANRKGAVLARLLAMKLLFHRTPRYFSIGLGKAALQCGVFGNLRAFLGMIKRLL